MNATIDGTIIATIADFLQSIGIPVLATELPGATFLPGLTMQGGAILYDPRRLTYPGDLLHEAGHIALTPAAGRPHLSSDTSFNLGDDLGAIAWSYAALMHLELDPRVVFHDGGYKGNSPAFISNFAQRQFVGVPMLEWAELTRLAIFPKMLKWLRD